MNLIPLRMLNEFVFCPRLFHYEFVQGLFAENAETVHGSLQHERAQGRRRARPVGLEVEEPWPQACSLHLTDEELGITGRLDAVEWGDEGWVPVEYKHGPAPDGARPFSQQSFTLSGDAWPNDQVQLCAQGLILRANGYVCTHGYLYYRKTRQRVRVDFDDILTQFTRHVIQSARYVAAGPIPPPMVESNKCPGCSLNIICLPDETNFANERTTKVRRIVPERNDGGVIYVQTPGARVSKSSETLIIGLPDGQTSKVPLKDVAHVAVFGNVQVTTQSLLALMESGRTVAFFSGGGRLAGLASGLGSKNVELRRRQFRTHEDDEIRLPLVRHIVEAKIANQRTLLRRNGAPSKETLTEMAKLMASCAKADSLAALRGIEGRAARLYFEAFPTMLSSPIKDSFDMDGRNKRPPRDPVNALLSFGYSLLTRDMVAATAGVGFDPSVGYYHSCEPGRPALALDLMEPFRPLIVDSVVLRLINTQMLALRDFLIIPGNVQLTTTGRKQFFAAYEQRMNEEIKHPVFGYKVSYRRVLELEVRLLARFLEGEIPSYEPLRTR